MFCINISWFVCTFVAVAIATNSNGEKSENYISESPIAEPVHKTQPITGVDLGATEGATATPAARSPEPPAQTRSLSPEEKGRRLRKAASQGAVEELEALLAAGADVEGRGGWSNGTALHWAAVNGQEEAARLLLAAGAAVDARDSSQFTPLHEAARQGHATVVRLLLAAGANPSARTAFGWTPLHAAADRDEREAAAILVEAGADKAARDNDGRTPLDVARLENSQQVVQLLEGNSSLTATTLPE